MAAIAASLLEVGQAFVLNPVSGKRVTWADVENGTFTATFAGTTAVTNTVYYAAIDDQWGQAATWVTGGSRTGDGVVTVTVPRVGTYYAWARSAEATPLQTPPVWFTVTDGTDGIWERLLDAVVSRIRSLGLTGLSSSEVFGHKVLTDEHVKDAKAESVLVAPIDAEAYQVGTGVVGSDDYDYPVLVAIVHPANNNQNTISPYWKWRDRIKAAFQERAMPVTGIGCRRCQVTANFEPTSRAWWPYNIGASFLRLTFTVRETRE